MHLGPIFSREGACAALFSALFDSVMRRSRGCTFHLFTEMQSPRAALLFKRLFVRSSYPRVEDGWIPERARATAAHFARRLPHIGAIDFGTLSTRSKESVFRGSQEYAPVVDWMRRRGVDFARGDAQIFIVTCGPSAIERAALRLEVWFGERQLSGPRVWKRRMLERFDRGAR